MSNIEIKNLTFGYQEALIFDHAQINMDKKWRLGLVGRNGRGKTTLLKLLSGALKTETLKTIKENFVYFPQDIKGKSSLLTLELLYECASFEQWKLERELKLLEVSIELLWHPFESLSGGEQTKCLLALLFLEEGNFPLIDEPTNHLDLESRKTVADYLKKKSGFIVASHDRQFLDEICDHILVIERKQILLHQGNFSTYEEQKKLRDAFELFEDEKLKKDISRLKKTAREKEKWSKNLEMTKSRKKRGFDTETKRIDKGFLGRKAANMMQKSKNLENRMNEEIEQKEKLLKNLEKIDDLSLNFFPDFHKVLVSCEDFTLGYDHDLFEPIHFKLERGQHLVLSGKNGTGKSSIVKVIKGIFDGQIKGKLEVVSSLQISYVDQMPQHQGTLRDFAGENHIEIETFYSHLRKLGMERSVFDQTIETMSQGQQKKVELAKSLAQKAQLYVWDEPLNYLDVFNHEQIITLIKTFSPSMLIIEHDAAFIEALGENNINLIKK